jgi:DNA repair protein RecN (Recombination protein N)
MLRELRVRNLAVIEEAVVPLEVGLNVLSGETGAGKSILIDAILLVVGGRAQPDLIRSGADGAVVEAVFEVPPRHPALRVLDDAGHATADGQIIVKRELSRAGRHRVFVNDAPATVGLLALIGDALVEIHGQHEHQRLLEPARQLDLLDRFGEAKDPCGRVREAVARWHDARGRLRRLGDEARESLRQEELLRFQMSEIDAVNPKDGEEDELRGERRRLQHAERILAALQEVAGLLQDDGHDALSRLGLATGLLKDLERLEVPVGAALAGLEEARAHVEDALASVRGLRGRAVLDPERIEEIDSRLDALTKLRRKYGESIAAIWQHRQEVAAALERLDRQEALAAELDAEVEQLVGAARAEALELSGLRATAAERLEHLVQRELRALGMERARCAIALRRQPAGDDDLATDQTHWRIGPRGVETVEFLLSANPGEDLRPLARVASGGELSRTMLGFKTILAEAADVPTMIFDEVDAGIGGRVADVVGQKLRETAAGRQVLCVTHLAQIAAHADHHLVVNKRAGRARTATRVTPLDAAGRVEELARMLGGERIGEATRRHARELYRGARRGGRRGAGAAPPGGW